jgi:hypothetical protein
MEPINSRLFDQILDTMSIDGSIGMLSYDSEDQEREWTQALYVLKAYGFIYIQDSAYSGIEGQRLTDEGIIFVSKGGFTEQARLETIATGDEDLQRNNWISTTKSANNANTIAWLSLGVSIIAAIIALL